MYRTVCCRALLALLLDSPPGIELLDGEIERKKFPDLVVKCLIRMTKRISESPKHLITQASTLSLCSKLDAHDATSLLPLTCCSEVIMTVCCTAFLVPRMSMKAGR